VSVRVGPTDDEFILVRTKAERAGSVCPGAEHVRRRMSGPRIEIDARERFSLARKLRHLHPGAAQCCGPKMVG